MVTRIACAAAVLACLSAASVEAQTWDGGGVAGGDVNWSVGTNWVGDVAPVNNGNAGIVMAGMIDTTNTVDINYDINTLTFNTTDGFTINNSGGATLTIRGGGIHNNSGQSQTINAPVALFGNQIWHANTGSLNFGAVNLAGSQLTLTSSLPSTVTTISGEISSSVGSGQLRPEGSGTLTLGGTNTFSGGVVLSSGTLRLNNDAALGTGTLFVQGSGGTIEAGTAPRIIANAINLQGNLTTGGAFNIDFSGAATLNANRTITVNNGLTTFSGVMGQLGGGQSLTKAGTGTVTFSGTSANTYTGNTNVNAGTLLLSKTTGVDAIRSPFVSIGDNSGGPGADVVRLAASNQITNTSQVLIYSTGAFDLNGNSETIGALEIHDGSVTTGAGILTLNTGGITTSSATFGTAMISGNLNLGSATRTVNVGNGAATVELDISAAIANGAITKTGAGTLQFSGTSANTYTGTTTINEGRLVLAKTTANGAILGDLIIGNGGGADEVEIAQPNQIAATANVTVNAGANLLVSAAEDGFGLLTLNGGSVTIGATGSLTIANDVAADRGVGELTVQIDGMDRPLLLNGARTFNVTGGGDPIIDFNTNARLLGGTLVKTGFGTMTLTGTLDNTTAGIINEGVLFLAKPDNVAALEGNIVIGDGIGGIEGDILQLGNDEQLKQTASDTLTINSSGLFVLSNNTETIGNLVLNGGHVDEGTLRMLGSVTVNSSPQTAVIFSDIDLGFASTNFDVNDGAAIVELDMIGDITNGTLNKTGAGTMSLEGTATNSSTINLNEGTLLLANALAAAIAGSLDVGDGFSGPGTDVVRLMADDQLADTAAAVSVQSSGLLDLNGFSDTVGALFISGGSIATGGGTLTLSSDLEVFGHPQMASIDGNLNLGNAPRTFFVEDGAAAIDLDISATIAAETGGQLIKTGAGTLQLDGTVHAPLVLNAGTLTGLSTIGPIGSFTQNAGTFDGTLTNQGTFTYNGGTFAGQLINEGIATLGDDLTAGNGVINFGTIALGVGQSLTTDGAGLENQGSITLTSGTIDGNGPLVNNSLLSGRGMIAGSAGFANNGAVSVAGGNLSLTNSGANANTGLITVPFGLQLRLLGGILTNTGTINLDGGSVSGTATLVNEAGGIVQGGSSVQAPMTNNGGLIHANAGTTLIITNLSGGNTNGGELRIDNGSGINVTNAFNSSGTIVLLGANAQLIGGAVTNTGTLRGSGRVSNS
ncbi:MAG: autotransporter-associated beta strand repeat-containing protein, partial [Pirellulales bacterium]